MSCYTKICPICKQQFLTNQYNKICCSYQCRREHFNARVRKQKVTKKCRTCKQQFVTSSSQKLYCCKRCFYDHQNAKHRNKPLQPRKCRYCKTTFQPRRTDSNYCSRLCQYKTYNDTKPRKTKKSYKKADMLRKQHIPQEQLEIIYGTLLGDASLILQTNNFHRLSLCHCEKQLSYLLYKSNLLDSIFIAESPSKYIVQPRWFNDHFISRSLIQYHIHSISHKDLTSIYGLFHRNKHKTVTMKCLKLLTPTSILFWYLDDGNFNQGNWSGKISTLSFQLSEHKAIKKWFWQQYRIETRIGKVKKPYKNQTKIYYEIRINRNNTKKLIELMSMSKFFKNVPQEMRYKFGPY